jgi:hypothetical protein
MDNLIILFFVVSLILLGASTTLQLRSSRTYAGKVPLSDDFLAHQARPRGRTFNVMMFVAALLCAAGLILNNADKKAELREVLGSLTTLSLLLSILLPYYCQRIRALEAIVRKARPDLYAKIRTAQR